MVFYLDLGEPAGLLDAAEVALRIQARLEDGNFPTLVKMSGTRGIHVWGPLVSPQPFDVTKPLAHQGASELETRGS